MPKISVIVPVYKVEPYLRRCIDSILGQTFRDFELILVDDGSPDGCPAICDEYAEKDSRIRVIHKENGGLSSARNAGLDWMFENSDSAYLTFIDSDDYVEPEYLEELYKALIDNDADVSLCGYYRVGDGQERIYENFSGCDAFDGIEACKMVNKAQEGHTLFVVACAKLYKRDMFEDIRYPVGKIHEDEFITYRILYKAHCVVELGRCLYAYTVNREGIMCSGFSLKRYDVVEALEEASVFYRNNGQAALADLTEIKSIVLKARFSLEARKAGLYSSLPKEYKMSALKAERTLKRLRGMDYAEYHMYLCYPTYIKIKAIIRRIFCGRSKGSE